MWTKQIKTERKRLDREFSISQYKTRDRKSERERERKKKIE
jgi:hypothetical protein